ncbi:hypothetical protein FIS3754_08810 [Fischerella sp. NIES-3754]|nr:hypothetical protein FIS3754_08810 [Fischerella sp. NIES-3754]BCX07241.1 MAG: hypothetical protein KatS3mg066_1100 [Fischerella sp.]
MIVGSWLLIVVWKNPTLQQAYECVYVTGTAFGSGLDSPTPNNNQATNNYLISFVTSFHPSAWSITLSESS